ncbi:MAG: metal-dependent hydrolase [Nanoarchaeota archaeon]|nr:metal-dependent hydrolase [Nanoarchaeota archaeon]
MIKRTHLVIGLAAGLHFLPFVKHKFIFIPIILIASLMPDIDSGFSQLGKKKIFRPVQLVLTHRGPLHSYTIGVLFSLILALFFPILALPFFLGYFFHLFADSFTVNGIKPFWPLKFQSSGVVRTGGLIDRWIFFIFALIDIVLFVLLFV